MVFKWKGSSRHTKVDAQKVGEELEKIRKRRGKIDAEVVVEESASKRSPMHELFTWDDRQAAHQHRLEQARSILRSIVSVKPSDDGDDEEVQTWVAVTSNEPNKSVYIPLDEGLAHKLTRREILERALAELRAFRRKYAKLKELAAIFQAIDDINA